MANYTEAALSFLRYSRALIDTPTFQRQCIDRLLDPRVIANVSTIEFVNGLGQAAASAIANNVTRGDVWGITYATCQAHCNYHDMPLPFDYSIFSSAMANYLLPFLALTAQLPYESGSLLQDVTALFMALGSPVLTMYSLSLNVIHSRALNRQFDELQIAIGNTNDELKHLVGTIKDVLKAAQHVPLRASQYDGWLSSVLVLPKNIEWWSTVRHLLMRRLRRFSPSALAQLGIAIIAYLLTVVAALATKLGDTDTGLQMASGSLWTWLISVVFGYIEVGVPNHHRAIPEAFEQTGAYNRRLADSVDNPRDGNDNPRRGDEDPHRGDADGCEPEYTGGRVDARSGITIPSHRRGEPSFDNQTGHQSISRDGARVSLVNDTLLGENDVHRPISINFDRAAGYELERFDSRSMLRSSNHDASHSREQSSGGQNGQQSAVIDNTRGGGVDDNRTGAAITRRSTDHEPENSNSQADITYDVLDSYQSSEQPRRPIRRNTAHATSVMPFPAIDTTPPAIRELALSQYLAKTNIRAFRTSAVVFDVYGRAVKASKLPKIFVFAVIGDSAIPGGIYSYARSLEFPFFVELIREALEERSKINMPTDGLTPDEIARLCGERWRVKMNLNPFPRWDEIDPEWWFRMIKAAMVALVVQWATTMASFMIAFLTPVQGLGCRSGSYLVYTLISTSAWVLLLAAQLCSNEAMRIFQERQWISNGGSLLRPYRPSKNVPEEIEAYQQQGLLEEQQRAGISMNPSFWEEVLCGMAISFRLFGKFLCVINTVWLLLTSVAEIIGGFDNCWCLANRPSAGWESWIVLFKTSQDLASQANSYWGGGLAITILITIIAMLFFRLAPSKYEG